MTTTKEKYSLLKKKYSLPDYDILNQEFDIEEINEESELILQKVRLKIHEKIEVYANIIEAMLQPESSLGDMYEAHYINDSEKNSAYSVFKTLKQILRYSNLVSLNNKDEENAKFIKESFEDWNSAKGDIQVHIKRLINVWKKETDIKDDLSYFG